MTFPSSVLKTLKWGSLSLVIHGLILGGFWLLKPANPNPPEKLEVELVSIPPESRSQFREKSVSPEQAHQQRLKKLAAKLLAPSYDYKDVSARKAFEVKSQIAQNFKDAFEHEEGPGALANNKAWEFHRQIYERVDSSVMFDSILAQYNHFGRVFVQFEVDFQGRLLNSGLRVAAADPILKVHSMRALRAGLRESFKTEKWNPSRKNAKINMKFEYLAGPSELNRQKQTDFGKPVMSIKRFTTEKPLPNDLQDHLLNGGIDLNVFAMVERWQKYNKRKKLNSLDFDVFSRYRRDPDYNL